MHAMLRLKLFALLQRCRHGGKGRAMLAASGGQGRLYQLPAFKPVMTKWSRDALDESMGWDAHQVLLMKALRLLQEAATF